MRIGVDVMGGDHAPDAILEGAIGSLERIAPDDQLVLVGPSEVINAGLKKHGVNDRRIEVLHAPDVIGMDESPAEAVRGKPESSIAKLASSAGRKAENPLNVIISAGNTGAMVAAAHMYMKRLPGVRRSGIAVVVPTFAGNVVLIDVGANIEPKPDHLAQYGVMGDVYARKIVGVEKPRIALMNVGGEEQKGTADMKLARDMLRATDDIHFTGYIEGRGVFSGEADVVITDGVVGNVMIKLAEGLSEGIFKAIAREVMKSDPSMAERFGAIVKKIYAEHDYHEYGGAPLLGVNGVCIISHGSSVARTITNAITRGKQFVECSVNQAIEQRLSSMKLQEMPA